MSEENEALDPACWPAWYYGPNDAAAIFHHPDEVPEGYEDHPAKVAHLPQLDHDGNGEPGGSTAQEPSEVTALRAEYKDLAGKKAFNGWNAEALAEKIAALKAVPAPSETADA